MKTDPSQPLDLAILGGGINGAGLAFLAARAGLSVALFEKDDWAQGTSSRSTKLLHGGIRYLEQGRIGLVRESLREKRSLLADAPHLARPLSFLLPVYRGDRVPPWKLKAGLWLYDLLAGPHNLQRHEWLTPEESLKRAPGLKPQGLLGCGVYWDAQVNDARLVLENVLGARDAGAYCVRESEVVEVQREAQGFRLKIRQPKGTQTITAKCLVDATGPWANRTSRLLTGHEVQRVRPTRGSHLVVPQVLSRDAVLVMDPGQKRILFVIPWRGQTLLGTTDVDDSGKPEEAHCTGEEQDYLLAQARRLFPDRPWDPGQVTARFAGLRPLAYSADAHASAVSREDRITLEDGVVTILGGKLTSYRAMAQKALVQVLHHLGRHGGPPPHTRLPGSPLEPWTDFEARAAREWTQAYGINTSQASHLVGLYGGRASSVLEIIKRDPALREPLHPDRPEIAAQVLYAVQREDALHLEDVLIRRLEIGYTPQNKGVAVEKAARLMADALGWDEGVRKAEVARYVGRLDAPGNPSGS